MKNLSVIIFIILTSLSACKDDCLTCPENQAVVNGECKCIGISFNGECMSNESALKQQFLHGTSDLLQPYFSNADVCNINFDFNNQPLFIYISDITEYDGKLSAYMALKTEARPSGTYFDKVYYAGLESLSSWNSTDSFYFNKTSGNLDYQGLVYCGDGNFGWDLGELYSTDIDGEVCYLRPYLKILDKDYIRVTFRYVTAAEEVKAECVRLFHK